MTLTMEVQWQNICSMIIKPHCSKAVSTMQRSNLREYQQYLVIYLHMSGKFLRSFSHMAIDYNAALQEQCF